MIPEPRLDSATGIRRYEVKSVTQLATIAADPKMGRTAVGREKGNELARTKDSWTENRNAQDCLAAIQNAPREIIQAIDTIRERIERRVDLPQTTVRRRRHGLDAGAELDPIAWVQRDPYGWSDTVREYSPKRVIKIGVNTTVNAALQSAHLLYRGACAVALADIFSSMGYDVELVAFQCSSGVTRSAKMEIESLVVKASDAPMNLSACAVSICDIAFVRTVFMAAEAKMVPTDPNAGLGWSTDLPAEDKRGFDVIVDQDVRTLEQAVERTLAEVRRASGSL